MSIVQEYHKKVSSVLQSEDDLLSGIEQEQDEQSRGKFTFLASVENDQCASPCSRHISNLGQVQLKSSSFLASSEGPRCLVWLEIAAILRLVRTGKHPQSFLYSVSIYFLFEECFNHLTMSLFTGEPTDRDTESRLQ